MRPLRGARELPLSYGVATLPQVYRLW